MTGRPEPVVAIGWRAETGEVGRMNNGEGVSVHQLGRLAGREKAGVMTFLNGFILRGPLCEKAALIRNHSQSLKKK